MKPFIHMLAETCSVLANGGAIIYIDQIHPDGTLYQDTWDQFKRLNAEIACREEFTGGEPVPYAGVYFSQDTRDFYGQDEFEERYMAEFVGACKALLEEHILFDIVTPRNLADLGKYKVIVLPNTACMSQREADALRQFVARRRRSGRQLPGGGGQRVERSLPAAGPGRCLRRAGAGRHALSTRTTYLPRARGRASGRRGPVPAAAHHLHAAADCWSRQRTAPRPWATSFSPTRNGRPTAMSASTTTRPASRRSGRRSSLTSTARAAPSTSRRRWVRCTPRRAIGRCGR